MGRPASRTPFPGRPWNVLLPLAGVAGIVALGASLAVVAVDPVRGALAATRADGATALPLVADGVHARVTAPEGWTAILADEDELTLRTPDGALTLTLTPSRGSARERVQQLLIDTDAPLAVVRTERLADGRALVHADGADGGVVAAVEVDGGVVGVVATLAEGTDADAYRPALAAALSGVAP